MTAGAPAGNVRVRVGATLDCARRIAVTRGVEPAGARVVADLGYRKGAICPCADWRAPSRTETAALLVEEPNDAGVTIDLAPAPPPLLRAFADLGFVAGRAEAEYEAALQTTRYPQTLRRALPELAAHIVATEGVQLLGVCVQPGNLWSTTTHTDPDEPTTFSGLHIDNWDQVPLGQRRRTRRQLCINLGAQDRYFVFASVDVDTMVRFVGTDFDRRDSYIGVGRRFFALFPDAPLVRLRVAPGEMYIAPTDNLVHDGSSLGSTAPDVTLSLRGHFRGVSAARALAELAGA